MGHQYAVQGSFTYETKASSKPVAPLLNHFALSFADCRWTIRVEMLGNTNLQFVACEWDGQNMAYSHGSFSNIANSGFVEAVPVPQRTTSAAIEIVWLAYASACYLSSLTNSSMLAFTPLRSSVGHVLRYNIEAAVDTSSVAPYLPLRVEYQTRNRVFVTPSGEVVSKPLAPPLTDSGYKSAEFTASRIAMLNGLSIPQSFIYREYVPTRRAIDGEETECVLTIVGTATNIWPSTHAVRTGLTSSDGYYAHDLRVKTPGTLYPVTNGEIPETSSPVVLEASRRAADRIAFTTRNKARQTTKYRNYLFAVAIIISALPCLALFRKGRVAHTTQTK